MAVSNGTNGTQNSAPIIYFGYDLSPYARKVVYYLQLRGLQFSRCAQPPVLPRPDLANLGVLYRRIPVLSIGRDIYADSALILKALDRAFPGSPLTPAPGADAAITALLSAWTNESGVFMRAVQCLPLSMGIWSNEPFVKDREQLMGPGADWSLAAFTKVQPEAIGEIKACFDFLESGILADGREWVLGTGKGPSLADLEAVWPFHWLWSIEGSLDDKFINSQLFPKVFAWIERFDGAVKKGAEALGEFIDVDGKKAYEIITESEFSDDKEGVDSEDSVKLQKGQDVEFFPTDNGSANKQPGKLVRLDKNELAVQVSTASGKSVRVHAPRHNFRVEATSS